MANSRNAQKRANKQPTEAPHIRETQSSIKWFQLLLFILSLGLISGANRYYLSKKTSSKEDDFEPNHHDIIPSCQEGGNLVACIIHVCDDVHNSITPINRDAKGETDYVINNNIIQFIAENPPSFNQLGGTRALLLEQEIKKELRSTKEKSEKALRSKIINSQFAQQSVDAANFLLRLDYLIQEAHVPTCSGMSSQVTGRLFSQPIVQSSRITITTQTMQAVGNPSLHHTFNNISGVICDSWRPGNQDKSVVCTKKNKKEEKSCNIYHPSLWQEKTSVSLRWPDLSKVSQSGQAFFQREVQALLKKLPDQEKRAAEYSKSFTQGKK